MVVNVFGKTYGWGFHIYNKNRKNIFC